MVSMIGSYQHEKSENLEAYVEKEGLPWMARKMMAKSNPSLLNTTKYLPPVLPKAVSIPSKLREDTHKKKVFLVVGPLRI